MKAIYRSGDIRSSEPVYCSVIKDDGEGVTLMPVDSDDENTQFWVAYSHPGLIMDPTDDEVEEVKSYD